MEQKHQRIPIQIITQAPKSHLLVFAANAQLFIYDTNHHKFIKSKDLDEKKHTDAIRGIQFSSDERKMVTCGDDKSVKVWDCTNWTLITERKALKKLSNAIFANFPASKEESKAKITAAENSVVYSDKFGDAFVFSLHDSSTSSTLLLGHCSIVTSMILSPNKKFLITSDKDEKIRVSLFPNAYEIQSFCLGHTSIVTKLCIPSDHPKLLVSGGGDLTLRLWNFEEGKLLHTFQFEELKDSKSIVAGIIYSSVSKYIAILLEGQPSIFLFKISEDEKSLRLEKKIELESSSNPLNLVFEDRGNLYVVGANQLIQYLHFDVGSKSFVPKNDSLEFLKELSLEVDEPKFKQIMENISLRQLRKKSEDGLSKKRKVESETK